MTRLHAQWFCNSLLMFCLVCVPKLAFSQVLGKPIFDDEPFAADENIESRQPSVIWQATHTLPEQPIASEQNPSQVYENYPAALPAEENYACDNCPWVWQWLPDGLLYHSYLAGPKESRMSTAWLYEKDHGWKWDATLGARVGIIRYGSESSDDPPGPEGIQLDVEAAAFTRLNVENKQDLEAVDFRIGLPLSWRRGPYAVKLGYYHISSHLGDEFIIKNPGVVRLNYVRDSVVLGLAVDVTPEILVYAETAYAFNADVAEPWEFQFGTEYSPAIPIDEAYGVPFFAINGNLREEFDFGGGVNVVAGWQFHNSIRRRLRFGAQYYNGKSLQYSFYNKHEELLGLGIWYDF